MRTNCYILLLAGGFALAAPEAQGESLLLQTKNLTLGFDAEKGGKVSTEYFGPSIDQAAFEELLKAGGGLGADTYPAYGLDGTGQTALRVEMPDGNISADLRLDSVSRTREPQGEMLTFHFSDAAYPFAVSQHYQAYDGTDVVATWTEIANNGKKPVELLEFASASLPLVRDDNYLTQFHGNWASENYMSETPLPMGITVVEADDAVRNAFAANPGFMISVGGEPQENTGTVFGGNLVWTGDYSTRIASDIHNLSLTSGINTANTSYTLGKGETFRTPDFLMTISPTEGKGGVSRAFHQWARKYGLHGADTPRDILLNSWEGVYMDVSQPVMDQMMADFSDLGGELFVMDDGWFGNGENRRLRDDKALGDWQVDTIKLPQGIEGLTASARQHGLKFGIWIEPEMANTASELFKKHPEWVMQQPNRPLRQGRGGTQVVLDMSNPQVQDFVFSIVDGLMSANPEIAYMKWDCNSSMMNCGSTYLTAEQQRELPIRYNQGLENVMQRIRAKYPDLVLQACASGGGRVNYGMLRDFDEFWASDLTDALHRLYIQWGDSHFYPARAMASHVSASPNHQTGRRLPLKLRFDVAMTGRLGMELQPKSMTDEEKAFARRAIAAYKEIRPVVQDGDLYRLISPYDNGPLTALMYASPDKKDAAVFVYRTGYLHNQPIPPVRLDGVDENLTYVIEDLTPQDPSRPCRLNGLKMSGKVLKNRGLRMDDVVGQQNSSVALRLKAVE